MNTNRNRFVAAVLGFFVGLLAVAESPFEPMASFARLVFAFIAQLVFEAIVVMVVVRLFLVAISRRTK